LNGSNAYGSEQVQKYLNLTGPSSSLHSACATGIYLLDYGIKTLKDDPDLDAVMMLRVQSERMSDSYFPSEREYARDYGLSENRLNQMKKGAIVMHPGPMNRGLEISAAAADSERSVILEQVANGVVVRMAVLYMLLGGVPIAGAGEIV
jgi:aspartate carbamoyltransferase catalytic subunit